MEPASLGAVTDLVVAAAEPRDLEAVLGLLEAATLPRDGVAEHFGEFLVARGPGEVVGCVGLERYGPAGLLRSLAVAPPHRGQGLGRLLAQRMVEAARRRGVARLFLLTETAPDFFPQFGFVRIERADADPAVQTSVEFRTACCQSAVCMRLDLDRGGG
jgi:amino-acid N-acetyltransferase